MAIKKVNPNDAQALATLALAAAIVDSDIPAARAALSSGADPEAFWVDGKTRLR
ncbi:hypothetical protein LP420_30370 [Massilia sp. B-10]|nr:hypothetical protein LP420_30370 [Massilia sp. B-10]